jgi:hypothetical protein
MLHSIFVVDWKKGKRMSLEWVRERERRRYWTVIIEKHQIQVWIPSEWSFSFSSQKASNWVENMCEIYNEREHDKKHEVCDGKFIGWKVNISLLFFSPTLRRKSRFNFLVLPTGDSLFSYYVYFILESLVLSLPFSVDDIHVCASAL